MSGASAQSWGPGARGRELSAGCRGGFFLGLGVFFRVGEIFLITFFFRIDFGLAALDTCKGLSWACLGLSWASLEQSWGPFGPSTVPFGSLLGRLCPVSGVSSNVFKAVKAQPLP